MSTKNYSGLRLDNGDVGSALDMLASQKQAVLELCNDKLIGLVAQRATHYVDALALQHAKVQGEYAGKMPGFADRMLNGKDEFYMFTGEEDRRPGMGPVLDDEHSPMVRAFLEIDDRQAKGRTKPTRDVNVDCDVQLFMHWDSQQKCLLAHFQEEGVGARNNFLTVPGVQDYAYWDHDDDLPQGVTRQAFENRGQVWQQAYKNPHKLTFTLDWQPDWIPEKASDLFPHLELASSRALTLATDECRGAFLEKNFQPVSPGSAFGVAGVIFKFADLLEDPTSDVRKERDDLAERIAAVLPEGRMLQAAMSLPLRGLAETGAPPAPRGLHP